MKRKGRRQEEWSRCRSTLQLFVGQYAATAATAYVFVLDARYGEGALCQGGKGVLRLFVLKAVGPCLASDLGSIEATQQAWKTAVRQANNNDAYIAWFRIPATLCMSQGSRLMGNIRGFRNRHIERCHTSHVSPGHLIFASHGDSSHGPWPETTTSFTATSFSNERASKLNPTRPLHHMAPKKEDVAHHVAHRGAPATVSPNSASSRACTI